MADKNFADGIRVSRRDNAPDFVTCNLGIHLDKFIAWAQSHVNQAGFVNVDIKRGKSGNYYAELNDWKPEARQEAPREEPDFDDRVPF